MNIKTLNNIDIVAAVPMFGHSSVSRVVTLVGSALNSIFHCLYACNRNSTLWCIAAVLIIETAPASSKFTTEPEKDLSSGRIILAKG